MRRIFRVIAPVSIATFTVTALAQQPAPVGSASPSAGPSAAPQAPPVASAAASASPASPQGAEAEAREHFDKGRKLLVESAFAAALPEFLESRRLFPSRSATSSAAVCLRKLERYDEALDLMEALLREFTDLPADVKSAAQAQVVELRALVGTIEIAGVETGATIIVNGQIKGEYPLLAPLRVPAGSHLVRLYKEGFETREVRADVRGQDTARVQVHLERLVQAGKLHVEEAGGKKLTVVIDGTAVGHTPWDGPVAPGEHSLSLRGDEEMGTLPKTVSIQANKEARLSLSAEKLDATLRIVPKPVDASVAVDGIFVGRGVFEGRLRPGKHSVKVVADGYFGAEQPVTAERGAGNAIVVALERDPSSPAWRKPGRFGVEVAGALALSPSFGGEVGECEQCTAGLGTGGHGAVYGGFEAWGGLGLGVSLGYVALQQAIRGRATELSVVGLAEPDQGSADDVLTLRAFQVGLWGSYRFGPERFPFRARLGAGVLLGTLADRRTGAFRSGGQAGACEVVGGAVQDADCFTVGPVAEAPFAAYFYAAPELRAGYRIGEHLELSIGVQALVSFGLATPRWNADSPLPNQAHPINALPDGYGTFAPETLSGPVWVLVLPGAALRYDF